VLSAVQGIDERLDRVGIEPAPGEQGPGFRRASSARDEGRGAIELGVKACECGLDFVLAYPLPS